MGHNSQIKWVSKWLKGNQISNKDTNSEWEHFEMFYSGYPSVVLSQSMRISSCSNTEDLSFSQYVNFFPNPHNIIWMLDEYDGQ